MKWAAHIKRDAELLSKGMGFSIFTQEPYRYAMLWIVEARRTLRVEIEQPAGIFLHGLDFRSSSS